MGSERILAIDQGTTSTRAVMFDAACRALATAQKPLPQIYPANGWVEHDPEEIWTATLDVAREVVAKTGGVNGVAAIGNDLRFRGAFSSPTIKFESMTISGN